MKRAAVVGSSPVASAPASGTRAESFRFRAFGLAQADLDLNLEPGRRPTPHLVTDLLAACLLSPRGDGPDRDAIWRMPVGKRIEGLLGISQLEPPAEIPVEFRCANPACAELIEVGLTIKELLQPAGEQGVGDLSLEVDGRVVTVRRPTGLDQLAWLAEPFEDEATALTAMLRSLLTAPVEGGLTDEVVAAVEDALDRHDQLGAFRLTVSCPYCEELHPYELDLSELLLGRVRQRQAQLVEEIHTMARAYHWTEGEILSIPRERRARYLALLEREAWR